MNNELDRIWTLSLTQNSFQVAFLSYESLIISIIPTISEEMFCNTCAE